MSTECGAHTPTRSRSAIPDGRQSGLRDEQRDPALSQWFTPSWLADRVVAWALPAFRIRGIGSVLEPAAGHGALLTKDLAEWSSDATAWDIDPANCAALRELAQNRGLSGDQGDRWMRVAEGDFLASEPSDRIYDLAIMNPPYERNQDVAFIERALDCSDHVVGIFQSRILHSQGRAAFWRGVDIRRMAVLTSRPRFGGDFSPKTDFVVLDLVRRAKPRRQGEATPTKVEWW